MQLSKLACCTGLLFAASTCFAQMYTVTDLGALGSPSSDISAAQGLNGSGQVVGYSFMLSLGRYDAFRTSPNSPINPATDDIGVGLFSSYAYGINASGQVVGSYENYAAGGLHGPAHGFRTVPNNPINPATDDLGTLGGNDSSAYAINDSGQVVGSSSRGAWWDTHAFRTAANSPINPSTDDLGTLGCLFSEARAINHAGQVAGVSCPAGLDVWHAFRTAPNSPINAATDDLGTLGGDQSEALGINDSGQVVGWAWTIPVFVSPHAFRTEANSPINPSTDDLGTLTGGHFSAAFAIDGFGQVVGTADTALSPTTTQDHAFIFSGGVMQDLNNLISHDSDLVLISANAINDAGQIAGQGFKGGPHPVSPSFLLTPIYKAFVQPPLNADGSSVFKANRRVIPVKFTLTQYGVPTCDLLPATIAITRTAGGKLGSIDLRGSSTFSIDPAACRYIYHIVASALGVGTYRVDIGINRIFVGHALFTVRQSRHEDEDHREDQDRGEDHATADDRNN